ncbi:alpha-amylase family protein [Vibrio sp. CAU 1672]|uniref:alpha-amylase family protein n=1 Tax=Vibrio sp. CAU 1672 TaxID=3032594 RepID=UPI0023DB2F61|nr:alpha-amylase family protein [Vibrio sp. CAU 1672]MDF2155124.1 alpha-amylase family protein [Vibrio sp. CAU 1672]
MRGSQTSQAGNANVILHAFDWKYADIAKQAKAIHELGYGSVLVSPPMKSAKDARWWQRYQPQDYRVIDNALGNTRDFKAMVAELERYGVLVYVDVVFNHMANEAHLRSDLKYPREQVLSEYAAEQAHYDSLKLFGDLSKPLFTEDDFVEAFGIEDWKDKWQVQNGRITGGPTDPGLPTLRVCDHVVQQQRAYLQVLKEIGVKGFRIDAAKHMTLEHLKQVWTEDIADGVHIFGEIITDGGATEQEYELFLEPYLKETRLGAYDFPLFSTIFKAFSKKGSFKSLIDPYCFGQALSKGRAITFAITHDIPNNDVFLDSIMAEEDEWLAYAYILGRDGGVPLIYTDLDTSGIKGKDGQPRWQNSWQDPRMVSMITFHRMVHGLEMTVLEGNDDMLVFKRGDKGIVVLNKSLRPQTLTLPGEGSMHDLLTDQEVTLGCEIKVPAKSAMMLLSSELVG